MESNQYKLCREVLRRLDKAGVLKHLIVIGSWCIPFYKNYFSDITQLLKDLGFILDFKGEHGVMRLEHPDLLIEFLVPELGRGTAKPVPLPHLGFNAQALRFLNFLMSNTITVRINEVSVSLPHPANFALHKLIISRRRKNDEKALKDRDAALQILRALVEKGEVAHVRAAFKSAPRGWQQKIIRELEGAEELSIMQLLKD